MNKNQKCNNDSGLNTYVINLLYRDSDCSSFPLWWRASRWVLAVPVRNPCTWAARPWRHCRSDNSEMTIIKKSSFRMNCKHLTHHSHLETRHVLALLRATGRTWSAFGILSRRFRLVLVIFVRRYWLMSIFVSCIRRWFCCWWIVRWKILVAIW